MTKLTQTYKMGKMVAEILEAYKLRIERANEAHKQRLELGISAEQSEQSLKIELEHIEDMHDILLTKIK